MDARAFVRNSDTSAPWWESSAAGARVGTRPMGTRPVVVAARRPPMLLSLKRLLEPEFEVAAMADNVLSLLDALKEIAPDLLVPQTGSAECGADLLAGRRRERPPCLRILLVGDGHAPA